MNEADIYREWAPPAAWRDTVTCLWEQRVGAARPHRVVPDGCADVILGSDGHASVVGLADEAFVHEMQQGSSCLGLRFRPEAVATVFGLPADELRNRSFPLDDVVGSRRARSIVDSMTGGPADPGLLGGPPAAVVAALRHLGRSSVDDAAAALGCSARHLRRLVVTNTGLGPKTYQRVVRLQRFLGDHRPLADAALAAGYADQAHLTREVTRLCGIPPARLRAERAA